MRSIQIFVFSLFIGTSSAFSAAATLGLSNVSQDFLVRVTAVAKGDTVGAAVDVLAGPVPSGQPGSLTIQAAEGQCLFDLKFTFASGRSVDRPDVDVCQTDGIEVN